MHHLRPLVLPLTWAPVVFASQCLQTTSTRSPFHLVRSAWPEREPWEKNGPRGFLSRHARRTKWKRDHLQSTKFTLQRAVSIIYDIYFKKSFYAITLVSSKQVMSELVDGSAWCSIKEPVLIICVLKHTTATCQPVRKENSLNLEMKASAIVNLYLNPDTCLSQITDPCEIWLLCLLLNDLENYFIVFGSEQTNFNFHLHGIVLSGWVAGKLARVAGTLVRVNIRRICSTDTFFDQRSRELIEYLVKRGYSRSSLQRDANRVRSIPRHATLQPQEKKSAKTDRTPFVTSFNPALPKISSVVNKYTTLLQSTANCKKAFPNPPVIAYRRNASLRALLVHSTLPHENSSSQQPAGIEKCNHPRCLTCSLRREGQTNYTFLQPTKLEKSPTPYLATHSTSWNSY